MLALLGAHHILHVSRIRVNELCIYNVALEASSCNHCCSGRVICITYSECVSVALVIQNAKRMLHVLSMACLSHCYIFQLCLLNATI